MSEEKVKVPHKVMHSIKAIRETGRTNMFDSNAVQAIANEMELYETVVWIEKHKSDWGKVIFGHVDEVENRERES